ncbi:2-methylaconitate cis-trans isomerase PrpF family protein [Amycolatopsis sp. H20-H5]|uniref:2-methylaconitate cis-trans isomerase PrpF family protein n=1 Tax=Amycolatopsis sp. H20-H5 TaxID=3046309 RepID=UPI002DB7F93C|nr:PrpF domain-containing protein [Amycolatopsis sp. H20-H5]MEC3980086.1 PrpF domain-containing protein [Amycolatopsis sp. H20-H5]
MSTGEQDTVRCVLMRGGTSKGLYFHESDLPEPGPVRDRLLKRLMGTPDVLQIDGLGGSRPITSKVAIVAPSTRDDADVDYTFAQIAINHDDIGYTGNCGNISSGVGPFAIDEGLVPAVDGSTEVRIHNTNTGKILHARVPVTGGRAKVDGEFVLPGVPGTGAEILMDWSKTVGAKTGKLLPTGRVVDIIEMADGRHIDATICDAGNPAVWVRASDFGLTGSELSQEINDNATLIEQVRELRGKAAVLAGLCTEWNAVDRDSPGIPLAGFVAPPADHLTLNDSAVAGQDMDLRCRLLFLNRLHESIAGTGSICLAAASRVPGSVVASVAETREEGTLLIGHPSGITPVWVETAPAGTTPSVHFELLGFSRTARRLMDATAYYPRSILIER